MAATGLGLAACGKTTDNEPGPGFTCDDSDPAFKCDDGEPEPVFTCDDPGPLTRNGVEIEGFVACGNGAAHRNEAVECAKPAQSEPGSDGSGAHWGDCTTDADCTQRSGGFCRVYSRPPPSLSSAHCVYPCTKDADCGEGYACFCDAPGGECVPAGCRDDADCDEGSCLLEFTTFECGAKLKPALACWTLEKECVADAECPFLGWGRLCLAGSCEQAHTCGRPFLVGEAERRASVVSRSDWSSLATPVSELDPALCAKLADHWAACAAMEHASIAAFARFTLELLSLGAPSELVQRATQALADETHHTELCFTLASRYAGERLGPGPLRVDGCLESLDPLSIATTAFAEACIGETVAAVEALEAATRARDPQVRAALERIASDESAHAELGFRFIAWLLESRAELRAELIHRLRAALDRELGRIAASTETASSEDVHGRDQLLEHGFVPGELSRHLRRVALTEVVEPCAAALLARYERADVRLDHGHGIALDAHRGT